MVLVYTSGQTLPELVLRSLESNWQEVASYATKRYWPYALAWLLWSNICIACHALYLQRFRAMPQNFNNGVKKAGIIFSTTTVFTVASCIVVYGYPVYIQEISYTVGSSFEWMVKSLYHATFLGDAALGRVIKDISDSIELLLPGRRSDGLGNAITSTIELIQLPFVEPSAAGNPRHLWSAIGAADSSLPLILGLFAVSTFAARDYGLTHAGHLVSSNVPTLDFLLSAGDRNEKSSGSLRYLYRELERYARTEDGDYWQDSVRSLFEPRAASTWPRIVEAWKSEAPAALPELLNNAKEIDDLAKRLKAVTMIAQHEEFPICNDPNATSQNHWFKGIPCHGANFGIDLIKTHQFERNRGALVGSDQILSYVRFLAAFVRPDVAHLRDWGSSVASWLTLSIETPLKKVEEHVGTVVAPLRAELEAEVTEVILNRTQPWEESIRYLNFAMWTFLMVAVVPFIVIALMIICRSEDKGRNLSREEFPRIKARSAAYIESHSPDVRERRHAYIENQSPDVRERRHASIREEVPRIKARSAAYIESHSPDVRERHTSRVPDYVIPGPGTKDTFMQRVRIYAFQADPVAKPELGAARPHNQSSPMTVESEQTARQAFRRCLNALVFAVFVMISALILFSIIFVLIPSFLIVALGIDELYILRQHWISRTSELMSTTINAMALESYMAQLNDDYLTYPRLTDVHAEDWKQYVMDKSPPVVRTSLHDWFTHMSESESPIRAFIDAANATSFFTASLKLDPLLHWCYGQSTPAELVLNLTGENLERPTDGVKEKFGSLIRMVDLWFGSLINFSLSDAIPVSMAYGFMFGELPITAFQDLRADKLAASELIANLINYLREANLEGGDDFFIRPPRLNSGKSFVEASMSCFEGLSSGRVISPKERGEVPLAQEASISFSSKRSMTDLIDVEKNCRLVASAPMSKTAVAAAAPVRLLDLAFIKGKISDITARIEEGPVFIWDLFDQALNSQFFEHHCSLSKSCWIDRETGRPLNAMCSSVTTEMSPAEITDSCLNGSLFCLSENDLNTDWLLISGDVLRLDVDVLGSVFSYREPGLNFWSNQKTGDSFILRSTSDPERIMRAAGPFAKHLECFETRKEETRELRMSRKFAFLSEIDNIIVATQNTTRPKRKKPKIIPEGVCSLIGKTDNRIMELLPEDASEFVTGLSTCFKSGPTDKKAQIERALKVAEIWESLWNRSLHFLEDSLSQHGFWCIDSIRDIGLAVLSPELLWPWSGWWLGSHCLLISAFGILLPLTVLLTVK